MARMVVALEPFAIEIKGKDVMVHDGDVFPADHPVVKGRAHLFKPVLSVEQATAAPGEKRNR